MYLKLAVACKRQSRDTFSGILKGETYVDAFSTDFSAKMYFADLFLKVVVEFIEFVVSCGGEYFVNVAKVVSFIGKSKGRVPRCSASAIT